jgi:hypothetical protein
MFKLFRLVTLNFVFFLSLAQAHSLLPDLKTATYPLYDHYIDSTTIPGRVLLRFSNGVANIGKGRMELRGGAITGDTQKVYQRIYTTHGTYYSILAGTFIYHPTHYHTHFNDFSDYKLREITEASGVGEIIARTEKVSFCLIDESIYNSNLSGFSSYRRYRSCGTQVQGISVGWVDVYDSTRDGQWIDVTDVASGTYWLESTADPLNRLKESNEYNNTTRIRVTIDHSAKASGDEGL